MGHPALPPHRHTKKKSQIAGGVCDLLDLIAILSAALFLLFVVFWLAGVVNGQDTVLANFPDWLKDALKTGKGLVTSAGATAILQLIRSRLKRTTGPQYLVWVLVIFFVLGFSSIGLARILKTPAAGPVAASADLFFNPDYADGTAVKFVHHYPHLIIEDVVRQSKEVVNPPSYLAHISLPTDGKTQFSADFQPEQVESRQNAPGSGDGWYSLCIQKASGSASSQPQIFLQCDKTDHTCDIDTKRNAGFAVSCSSAAGTNGFHALQAWLNPTFAQAATSHVLSPKVPFWTVPLLETLQKTNDKKRVGYTRFDIELSPDKILQGSNAYQYQVLVNGQPIFFNGFPPEVLRDTFAPGSPLRFSFGLENLSFSGKDNGFEDLTIQLTFLKGSTQTAQVTVNRRYVALRDADTQQFSTSAGSLTWAGKYIAPPHENKYEVLVNSTPDVNEAMRLKSRLDHMNFTINSKPAVLVVRPPLRIPPYYGVAVGIVQPTGQVQFTFDQDEASQVCSWAIEHSKETRILRSDLRRYEVATRGYAPCP